MDYMEFSAKTLDDAITKACEHFEVPSTKLDYDVIDHGANGFLGIGARDAKIKARIKEDVVEDMDMAGAVAGSAGISAAKSDSPFAFVNTESVVTASVASPSAVSVSSVSSDSKDDKIKEADVSRNESGSDHDINDVKESSAGVSGASYDGESHRFDRDRHGRNRDRHEGRSRHGRGNKEKKSNVNLVPIDDKNGVKVFLDEMFKAMDMEVNIDLKYAEEERILDVDFSGPSMGVIIGKRGQTLDAIQYLTSLVVNKGEEEYIHVKVDTENYRKRRKDTLENLAKNISFKVKRSRRPVSLEPMNPYERRIIHSALQNDRFVTTYSEGTEPYRRVVVAPKNNHRGGEYDR